MEPMEQLSERSNAAGLFDEDDCPLLHPKSCLSWRSNPESRWMRCSMRELSPDVTEVCAISRTESANMAAISGDAVIWFLICLPRRRFFRGPVPSCPLFG